MKIEDLAELTGMSVDELKAQFDKSDCISINLNGKGE
jgi:hypothetical protein